MMRHRVASLLALLAAGVVAFLLLRGRGPHPRAAHDARGGGPEHAGGPEHPGAPEHAGGPEHPGAPDAPAETAETAQPTQPGSLPHGRRFDPVQVRRLLQRLAEAPPVEVPATGVEHPPPPPVPDDVRARFTAAATSYRDGDYEEAAKAFVELYDQEGLPAFAFNAAMSYQKEHDCPHAVWWLGVYALDSGGAPDLPVVQQRIQQLQAECPDAARPE